MDATFASTKKEILFISNLTELYVGTYELTQLGVHHYTPETKQHSKQFTSPKNVL